MLSPMLSVYENCPGYETDSFLLRLVEPSDAQDLLVCYSDPKAVRFMNADRCTSDFYYQTHEEMKQCIAFWLQEYGNKGYVRFAVVPKALGRAAGTIEMFGSHDAESQADWGMLRIDIASAYESADLLQELYELAARHFYEEFRVKNIVTKAIGDAAERKEALKRCGFARMLEDSVNFDRPRNDYFFRPESSAI